MYLDGGMSDSVPLKAFEKMGYDKNIVVLTRPKGYRKKQEKAGIMKLVYRKYPKLVETMAGRANMYNETMEYIERLEDEGKIIVIRPSEKKAISRMEKDPEKLKAWYEVGRKDTLKILDKIKAFYNM
jgi:predicted patatin/cPLA2 family phospholipase